MFTGLLIDTIIVYPVTDGSTDRYGNSIPTEGSGVAYPARVQQDSSTEALLDRDTRHTRYKVFLPPAAVIDALSVVEFEGRMMRVVGEPKIVQDGIGPHHGEVVLEHFEG